MWRQTKVNHITKNDNVFNSILENLFNFFSFCIHRWIIVAKIKFSHLVTSDQRKNHKQHFNVPSHIWRTIMSSPPSTFWKSWERSTMFDLCPLDGIKTFRLSNDTTKGSRLAKESKCTETNISFTLNVSSKKKKKG